MTQRFDSGEWIERAFNTSHAGQQKARMRISQAISLHNIEQHLLAQNLLDVSKRLQERGKTAASDELFHDAMRVLGYDEHGHPLQTESTEG